MESLSAINKTMKTRKASIGKLILLLLVVTGLSACKKGEQTPPLRVCENNATFILTNNADGYYGKYLIQLEDGSYLYPCTVEGGVAKDIPYNGMTITVSYEVLGNEEGCQGLASVTKGTNEPIINELPNGCIITRQTLQYQRAKITCLSPVSDERNYWDCVVE